MVDVASKKRKVKRAEDYDDRKSKCQLEQWVALTMGKKYRAIEFAVLAESVVNLGDKLFVLQDKKNKLTTELVDVCGGQTAYKRKMKAMRERRSGEDMEEEDSLDWDSDDESQASQMEILLELMEEIGQMKKMRYMAHVQIDAINTRADIDANTVVKKRTRICAD